MAPPMALEAERRERRAATDALDTALPRLRRLQAGEEGEGPFDVHVVVEHRLDGTGGVLSLRVQPEWAPIGVARFKALVEDRFFDDACFFRTIDGFMAQIGLPADPADAVRWRASIPDDSLDGAVSNARGRLTFATSGPNSRDFQLFVNLGNNAFLDEQGFTPIAEVTAGMEVADGVWFTGEGDPDGPGPSQATLGAQGNAYLLESWPDVSCVRAAWIGAREGVPAGVSVPPARPPTSPLPMALGLTAAALVVLGAGLFVGLRRRRKPPA